MQDGQDGRMQKKLPFDIQKGPSFTLLYKMKRFLLMLLPLFWGIMNIVAQEEEAPDTARVFLKGRVLDESQDPVSLCQVRIEGQPFGTTASIEGQYNLTFRTADSVVVVYSMIGYETRRRVLKKPRGNLTLNIVMKESGKGPWPKRDGRWARCRN